MFVIYKKYRKAPLCLHAEIIYLSFVEKFDLLYLVFFSKKKTFL